MRQIFIVNATQVVTSESHPEGIYSTVSGYPKTFDSNSYDSSEEKALNAAKSVYFSQLSTFYVGSAARTMWTVTLERADGRQVMRESAGAFPDVAPTPEEEVTE